MHILQKSRRLMKQRERTLNVRFPNILKDKKDVEGLFTGDFIVKLPRQSSRSCHVVFSSVEEKIKNQKLAKRKTINGKRIVVQTLDNSKNEVKNTKDKKVLVPKIKPDIIITQTVFVSNIVINTKPHEISSILPGCVSITLLKPYNKRFRSAIVKMESIQVAAKYLKKEHKWPVLKGIKLYIKPDTRIKHKKRVTIKTQGKDTIEECKT